MRKVIISLLVVIFLASFASASIIIIQQPNPIYNIGDTISLPLKVTVTSDTANFFNIYLICNGLQTEVYKEYLVLSAGEEKEINSFIPVIKSLTGRTTGTCTVKAVFGEEYILTNEFEISDRISIEMKTIQQEVAPREALIIEGNAKKDNGEFAEGVIEASIVFTGADSVVLSDTVNNGYFYLEYPLPENTKSGQHLVKLNVYEKNSIGEIINQGSLEHDFRVLQVPTSLEMLFENSEIEPGTSLKVKAVLRDQTGEKISSSSTIKLEDSDGKIRESAEVLTDEFFEFPIAYNEPPAEWSVTVSSNEITTEENVNIIEKEAIKTELINKTLIITNIGNVKYCKSVLVKIGEQPIDVDVCLDVDENQKYLLTAPDGKYKVEIVTDEGAMSEVTSLTGKTIQVKKAQGTVVTLMKYPFVWIFIFFILGFVAFMVLRKGYKRSFYGYAPSEKKKKTAAVGSVTKTRTASFVPQKNIAELSLSIKGDKQDVSLVCLDLKNFRELSTTKKDSEARKVLQRIADSAERHKAAIYDTQDKLFYIFVPSRTRTFKNEKTSLELAEKIKSILDDYNRVHVPKIDFGISLNYGTIVSKEEDGIMKFMSMGTLNVAAKKFASLSNKEILLSESIKDKLGAGVKTDKQMRDNVAVYAVREIRKETEEHKKFISEFMRRMEK